MKLLSTILFSVLLLGLSDFGHAASIKKDHFEAGKNLTAGNVHPKGAKHLAQLVMDLQDADSALSSGKADYAEATFSATFTQAVGAKTVLVKKVGKLVMLEIPVGTTADGGGGSIASGAGAVPAAYRPAADLSWAVVVSDNGAKVFGKLVLSSAGTLTFTASAAGGNFTDDAAAGFDRVAISYSVP